MFSSRPDKIIQPIKSWFSGEDSEVSGWATRVQLTQRHKLVVEVSCKSWVFLTEECPLGMAALPKESDCNLWLVICLPFRGHLIHENWLACCGKCLWWVVCPSTAILPMKTGHLLCLVCFQANCGRPFQKKIMFYQEIFILKHVFTLILFVIVFDSKFKILFLWLNLSAMKFPTSFGLLEVIVSWKEL